MTRDGVGIGEDDFTSDTVVVEFLVPLDRIPCTSETELVLFLPLLDVVSVHLHLHTAMVVTLGDVLIKLVHHAGVEIRAVLLAVKTCVAV